MHPYRTFLSATLALGLAACGTQISTAGDTGSGAITTQAAQNSQKYLIGFKRGHGADRSSVARAGGRVTDTWANIDAVAAYLPARAIEALRNNPNVEYIEEDAPRYALGRPSGISDQARPAPAPQTPSDPLWTASGEYTWGDVAVGSMDLNTGKPAYTGVGVAVCVGDTGIDANHPEFGRKFVSSHFANFTGEAGRDDAYLLNDVSHHGTHVSGTIWAKVGKSTGGAPLHGMSAGGVAGVAPGVSLYHARVLGDDGSGSTSGVINGVNWCVDQLASQNKGGVEQRMIVSLSLGASRGSRTEQRAYDAAYAKGALIIAASGNDGGRIGYPAAYSSVVAVGAIDDRAALASFSNYGREQELVGPGVNVLSTVPVGKGVEANASVTNAATYSSVNGAEFSGTGTVNAPVGATNSPNNEMCGVGTRDANLSGKIALISRGNCSFEEKADNAKASGALAVIIYNNADGPLSMTLTNQKTIPVVGITMQDGQNTLDALKVGAQTGTVTVGTADYAYYDGTSMATPHVSAAAALVWAAKPTLSNVELRDLLRKTATDLGTPGADSSFGYGLVNPKGAIGQ